MVADCFIKALQGKFFNDLRSVTMGSRSITEFISDNHQDHEKKEFVENMSLLVELGSQ